MDQHSSEIEESLKNLETYYSDQEDTLARTPSIRPVDPSVGFYSSSQFMGAFVGSVIAGWLHGQFGLHAFFLCAALAALVWLLLARGMVVPAKLSNYVYRPAEQPVADGEALAAQLRALAGVAEVVVAAEEGVAYLKIDRQHFDESSLP